ncbi:exocyst complex component Sec3-domain-containing protein [Lineolata rhizophorae]|uniref:Exocyst complex component Sec3-domain-containing protein n=1 Tax=Lineolata rhizophorae TaxID=578093 RepID=A0A6A6P9V2_9PEZI|nr:exocyst complex component Sec3-domain-containing protein [Lineolata rhizophorae]
MDGSGGPRPRNLAPVNGSAPRGPPPILSPANNGPGGASMTRAERFEDERKRIVESCFSKSENNQLVESYITHIRVIEDAGYPQAPPPPDSPASNKKARVIICAVRNTGRVRMHKGRENANGTFSIGKTWNLEDLTGISSFTGLNPTSVEESRHKEWAGLEGFMVTMNKPYYWQANTAKEKEFFIASLIKIYKKYTHGKLPELVGFSPHEMDAILAPSMQGQQRPPPPSAQGRPTPPGASRPFDQEPPPPRSAGGQPSPNRGPPPNSSPDLGGPPPLPGMRNRPLPGPDGRPQFPALPPRRPVTPGEDGRALPGQRSGSSQSAASGEPLPPRGPDGMRQARPRPPGFPSDPQMRQPASRENLRPGPAGAFPPPRLSPQSSMSEMERTGPRPGSAAGSSVSSRTGSQAPQGSPKRMPLPYRTDGNTSSTSLDRPNRVNGVPASDGPKDSFDGRPLTGQSTASSAYGTPRADESMNFEGRFGRAPPERRRPPLASATGSNMSRGNESNDEFGTPLTSPPPRRDDVRTGARPTPDSLRSGGPGSGSADSGYRQPEGYFPSSRPSESSSLRNGSRDNNDIPLSLRPGSGSRPSSASGATTPPAPQAAETPPAPVPAQVPAPAPGPAAVEPEEPKSKVEPEPDAVKSPGADSVKSEEEDFRPGLGPMFKKKATTEAANAFRKAATAYGAFKPRAGGAAERLFKAENKTTNEPDGITSVVPAPLRTEKSNDTPTTPADEEKPPTKELSPPSRVRPSISTDEVPAVTVSSPTTAGAVSAVGRTLEDKPLDPATQLAATSPPVPTEKPAPSAAEVSEARRQRRRSNQHAKYLTALGIDPGLLEGRGLEFETVLSDFGWSGPTSGGSGGGVGIGILHEKKVDVLEADLRREIAKVEAGSWLTALDHKDDRVDAVEKMLDKAITECDELEGLLTLYGVELSSLNDDIAYIEAQSQGLQVQTANQKLLQSELKNLLETISITSRQLEPLRRGSIGNAEGLENIEESLLLLYKAMITIDPALRQSNSDNSKLNGGGFDNSELSTLRALQEKKERYLNECAMFLERLKQFMDMTFGAAIMDAKDALTTYSSGQSGQSAFSRKLDVRTHDIARSGLWQYGPLMLFAKEIDIYSWESLIKMYQNRARVLYQEEFRDNVLAWKKNTRKPTGEEAELLFTTQEKESEGISGTARKLTVKRSQTLARSLRTATGEKSSPTEKSAGGKIHPFEAFAGVLEETTPLVFTEQNFIVDFFHATSAEDMDFADAVLAAPPESRKGTNVSAKKLFEPDRAMAKRVVEVMDDMFAFWPADLQSLVEWAIKSEPLQGVGILAALDRTMLSLEETNQDFLSRIMTTIHTRLAGMFSRFVDEQIRAIEDTKVKIKKRKGVIAFIKTFPPFSAAIEAMLPPAAEEGPERFETRAMIDEAYARVGKAMFESLKVIAKESPAVASQAATAATSGSVASTAATGGQGGAGDPSEDKEVLNYHILLIENMNHFVEEVDERGDAVLQDLRIRAREEMDEHLGLYVDAVIRRPLGKLLVSRRENLHLHFCSTVLFGVNSLTEIIGFPRVSRRPALVRHGGCRRHLAAVALTFDVPQAPHNELRGHVIS